LKLGSKIANALVFESFAVVAKFKERRKINITPRNVKRKRKREEKKRWEKRGTKKQFRKVSKDLLLEDSRSLSKFLTVVTKKYSLLWPCEGVQSLRV